MVEVEVVHRNVARLREIRSSDPVNQFKYRNKMFSKICSDQSRIFSFRCAVSHLIVLKLQILHQVTDEPLHTLKVHESGVLVATGCEGGNVALMELTDGLASANRNDKTAVTAMFERETRREKILEVRRSVQVHLRSG